jgi:hypothetical protein
MNASFAFMSFGWSMYTFGSKFVAFILSCSFHSFKMIILMPSVYYLLLCALQYIFKYIFVHQKKIRISLSKQNQNKNVHSCFAYTLWKLELVRVIHGAVAWSSTMKCSSIDKSTGKISPFIIWNQQE